MYDSSMLKPERGTEEPIPILLGKRKEAIQKIPYVCREFEGLARTDAQAGVILILMNRGKLLHPVSCGEILAFKRKPRIRIHLLSIVAPPLLCLIWLP